VVFDEAKDVVLAGGLDEVLVVGEKFGGGFGDQYMALFSDCIERDRIMSS
jgi:hypothetical protein